METDSLGSSATALDAGGSGSFIWPLIAITELVIICYLLYGKYYVNSKKHVKTKGELDIEDYKKSKIDMNGLMNSINKSKSLYKKLSRVCHPDRFINSNKRALAEELFKEITRNKRDYEKLEELKERASQELGINI